MNQIFVGKVLHRCGECGQFRVTEDCLMCDCKFNSGCARLRPNSKPDHIKVCERT